MKYVNIHTYNISRTIALKCFAQKKGFYNVLISLFLNACTHAGIHTHTHTHTYTIKYII